MVKVGKLRTGAGELGKVSLDGQRPYAAEYGTHNCGVWAIGVRLCFGV